MVHVKKNGHNSNKETIAYMLKTASCMYNLMLAILEAVKPGDISFCTWRLKLETNGRGVTNFKLSQVVLWHR